MSSQRFILGLLEWLSQPSFDWIQVEVTSHCNAACIYCPRTVYRSHWQDRHLSMETFLKLLPHSRGPATSTCRGGGSRFSTRDFSRWRPWSRIMDAGSVQRPMAFYSIRGSSRRSVESGIDVLAFSLAGTGEENDRIRKGTSLVRVLDAIRILSEEKEKRRVQTPVIHIAYMLFQSGFDALPRLPSIVEGLGVSSIVISTLDFVASEELRHEVVRPQDPAEYDRWRSLLDEVSARGREKAIEVHYHLPHPSERRPECTENVQRAVCISSDGAVTPCVYTNLELPGCSHFAGPEARVYRRMAFGNVGTEPIEGIWRRKEYKEFRSSFRKGTLLPPCQGCPNYTDLWTMDDRSERSEVGGQRSRPREDPQDHRWCAAYRP